LRDADEQIRIARSDGAEIAVWAGGGGPPVVLVHGSLRDHRSFDALVPSLRPQFRTFALDRRGYGASRDGDAYAIERESDDVAAVVDAISVRTQSPVTLFGHSYGAGVALGAACRTDAVHRLVLYEPGLGIRYPPGWIDAQAQALADGDVDGVVRAVLGDILDMPAQDIEARRATPRWAEYRAAAPLVLREARVEDAWVYRRSDFDALQARTLLVAGSASGSALADATAQAAAAIPGARRLALEGHGHLAHLTAPALLARVIRDFALG
jgi:pimeloyl-ACP methyl ester carboxylesterase